MQDRYVADLGDFLKLGLLHWLVGSSSGQPPLQLGVIWYRVPDEKHNGDGKHTAYLRDGHRTGRALRALDPGLFDHLRAVHESGSRSITMLESSGALPAGARTYQSELTFRSFSPRDRTARAAHRRQWFDGALGAVQGCALVFVDPDNGIRRTDHPVPAYRNKSEKHAYLDEVRTLVERGQSVVAYHHADRSAKVEVQVQRRMADVAEQAGVRPIAAVVASRGTTRLFIIVPAPTHFARLSERLDELALSPWSTELRILDRA